MIKQTLYRRPLIFKRTDNVSEQTATKAFKHAFCPLLSTLSLSLGLSLTLFSSFGTARDLVDAPSTQNSALETISVTASRQAQSTVDVPASVSVINQDMIERIEAQHINQITSRIAGTWISRGNGQEHLTAIRSPVLTGAGSCGAFFMALDGISLRAPGFCNANQLFDSNTEQAARIEVLKGPASTLYGTNALHGAINIITPSAFERSSSIGVQVGAYDFARLSGQYQWESDNSAFLAYGNANQENGFQTESGYDQQKATLVYEHVAPFGNNSSENHSWRNKTVVDIANLNQETAGFIQGFRAYEDKGLRRINPNPEAFRDVKSLRAYSQFVKTTDTDRLSITPYVRYNDMQFLQHFLPWQALEENEHSSVGLQVQYDSRFAGAELISGIDADFTQASLIETQDQPFSPSIPEGEHYNYEVDAIVMAAFAQAKWNAGDLSFILGARVERSEYDYNNKLSDGSACESDVAVCRFSRPPDQTVSFSSFSPSATLEYRFSDALMSYVKYSQGFRAPQATELFRLQNNQVTADLDEVDMDAVEAGVRYSIYNHSLHLAAYDMAKENVIISDTNRQNVTDGETSHQGLELEYRWQVLSNLRLSTNLTFQRHRYESNLAITDTPIEGNRVDTSPDRIFAAQVLWQATEKFETELAWQTLSAYYLDPENTAEYEGHSLLDLTLRYAVSDTMSIKLGIFNALDEDYAERADFAFGNYRYFVGQPRRAFVSVNWIL
uniref:TonB-dependent receptor n=1 Tax=Ningiella ruwaisensis TaxID=2364274 RepID=UPI00109F0BB3|nr:TonB-dependent receptor [Ningiella ruwaisensis]